MNLIFCEKSLLLQRCDDVWCLPTGSLLTQLNYQPSEIAVDGVALLGNFEAEEVDLPDGLEFIPLRQTLSLFPEHIVQKIIYAEQTIHYQNSQRYCSQCGCETILASGAKWLVCQECHREIYPLITPAMIVRVTRGDQILMAQANNFAPTQWSILAGFCEVGESLEQTVAREVFEEVGIQIKNIRYWGSQYWPFPNSLMVGFTAEYASGEIVLDTKEMRAAGFYGRDELPGRPSTPYSIANQMIDDFFQNQ